MNYLSSLTSSLKTTLKHQVDKVKSYIEEETKQLQQEQDEIKKQNEEEKLLDKIKNSDSFETDKDDKEILENAFRYLRDIDNEHADNQKICLLPWQGLDLQNNRIGIEKIVKEEVLKLSQDINRLSVQQLEFEYDYDFDKYLYVAQILLKIDPELSKTRNHLVPEFLEEDEFWRNYFYQVELVKAQLGLKNKLGDHIKLLQDDENEDAQQVQSKVQQNEESKREDVKTEGVVKIDTESKVTADKVDQQQQQQRMKGQQEQQFENQDTGSTKKSYQEVLDFGDFSEIEREINEALDQEDMLHEDTVIVMAPHDPEKDIMNEDELNINL